MAPAPGMVHSTARLTSTRLRRACLPAWMVASLLFLNLSLQAATGGSISGTVSDPSGAVVSGAALSLVNTAQQTTYEVHSDKQGMYSFPNLPVGQYDLTISAAGFIARKRTALSVDTDSAMRLDFSLVVGTQTDSVLVTSTTGVQVDTVATHLGEVISGSQMTALPLNG